MAYVYCEFCGQKFNSVSSMAGRKCTKHPDGVNKGFHKLYEGSEKSQYICKYCGMKFSSLSLLTYNTCSRHPNGVCQGRHAAML